MMNFMALQRQCGFSQMKIISDTIKYVIIQSFICDKEIRSRSMDFCRFFLVKVLLRWLKLKEFEMELVMKVEIIASSALAVRISDSIKVTHPDSCVRMGDRTPSQKTLSKADIVLISSGKHNSAMSTLQNLKAFDCTNAPVFLLTVNSSSGDRAAALEKGADECLTLPMDMREIPYRIDALLRRDRTKVTDGKFLSVGELVIDTEAEDVYYSGKPLDLSVRHYQIIRTLMDHASSFIPILRLEFNIYGTEGDRKNRATLAVLQASLRRRLVQDCDDKIVIVRPVYDAIGIFYDDGSDAPYKRKAISVRPRSMAA